MATGQEPFVDWSADPYWQKRRIAPPQLLIHDIRTEPWNQPGSHAREMLEIKEVLPSAILPDLDHRDRLASSLNIESLSPYIQERQLLSKLLDDYGWMNCLRSQGVQESVDDPPHLKKLRWIHISSKYTEYLQGCLLALSDWTGDQSKPLQCLRQLDVCVQQNERFSKHGRYFTPFYQPLNENLKEDATSTTDAGPMLISVPFLDWGVMEETPPLRFQIDPREGYQSNRGSSHLIRSVLQYFYRLEDTSDREHHQVFSKHRPWIKNRNLDLRIRRWYGHYPTALNVDEVWILVIDPRHVVTFSTNQTWKSRWPPMQVSSRIAEISFRGIRNKFFTSSQRQEYDAFTHVVVTLSAAVGLLHRSFWADLVLCLSDRYAGYLEQLQFRLHRAPSTKLVMDLLRVQEELNIIINIMQRQIDLLSAMQVEWKQHNLLNPDHVSVRSRGTSCHSVTAFPPMNPLRSTFGQYSSSSLTDPLSQLLENLHLEFNDLRDLRENSNNLVNRTVQLVNIRLEDHGKAILVFTIVTMIFLPLSFVTSFFGMNFSDIRDMEADQRVFWIVAGSLTTAVVVGSILLAFYGGWILEKFMMWKEDIVSPVPKRPPPRRGMSRTSSSFQVLDMGIAGKDDGI